jgi:class 3 adenylate cyclase
MASAAAVARPMPCESVGPRQIKGREEPVEVFRVLIR